jgi:serine/threonine protein kinase
VEAETEMAAWVFSREQIEGISRDDPEMMTFLTELVSDRFDTQRPLAQRTIGKYTAAQIIGRGGYSIVYKGIHSALNMPVVIKMMRHHFASNPDFIEIFRTEAQTIANLRHENIVQVYDIEEKFRTVFIIMEYLEGEPMKKLLGRLKVLPPDLAAHYLVQVCAGLDFAHHRGIIHRDINSTNLMVLPGDRIKILDFGLACPIGTEDFSEAGTPHSMAPEQIQSESLDQRTDIYALGIMAYEMLTGKKPFPDEDLLALRDMHLHQDIPDPAQLRPDLPEYLRAFIRKACQKDPALRYQSAIEAMKAILPYAQKIPVRIMQPHPNPSRRRLLFTLDFRDEESDQAAALIEEFKARAQKNGIAFTVSSIEE